MIFHPMDVIRIVVGFSMIVLVVVLEAVNGPRVGGALLSACGAMMVMAGYFEARLKKMSIRDAPTRPS